MKAVGYKVPGPIAEDASLVDIDLPRPVAEGGDIPVEVKAVSVNPVDYKIRSSTPPADGDWKVLGWDAAGIVQEVGPDVTQFAVGDEVYYAGSLIRPAPMRSSISSTPGSSVVNPRRSTGRKRRRCHSRR